jgi:hypothetical protein
MRNVDPHRALFRALQAGLIRPIEDTGDWETWTEPLSPSNWPNWYFRRDDVLSIWLRRCRLVKGEKQEYFGLVELAQSWAEATGEAWPIILYRLCDWAVTDAFPDDAFLMGVTSKDRPVTFHKNMIFRRGEWHIQGKLLREPNHQSKERMQEFADLHLEALGAPVVGRDVVLAACQAMDVTPPPICGSIVAAPARHAMPPEPPPDTVAGVFARDNERDRELRRGNIGKVMPPDEAEKHMMLWDAAAALSRENGETIERNWLRLIDAFWCGYLSPSGLVYFYRAGIGKREFSRQKREVLAGLLLDGWAVGDGTSEPAQHIENLKNWTVADYLKQPKPFGDFFRHDPEGRFGLAVLASEFDRWHKATKHSAGPALPARPEPAAADNSAQRRQRRGGYAGALAIFTARYPDEMFKRLSDQDIAREFERHCQQQRQAGKPVLHLPKDRRNVENQVAKIRVKRLSNVAETADPNNA